MRSSRCMLMGVISVNEALAYNRLPVRFKPAQVTGTIVLAAAGVVLPVPSGSVGEVDTTGVEPAGWATSMEQPDK